jgi:phage terminase large subunit-like protein
MMMVSELMAQGVPVIEVRPLVLNFSEPMKQMDGLIRSRKTAHNGDPVYTWMLSNVVAKPDKKDNVYPNKDRAENKIDGPVAHMMALARFMSNGVSTSIFDRDDLWKSEDVAVQAQ